MDKKTPTPKPAPKPMTAKPAGTTPRKPASQGTPKR